MAYADEVQEQLDARARSHATSYPELWLEVFVQPGAHFREIMRPLVLEVSGDVVVSWHAFWDEPWWPGAYVLRICCADKEAVRLVESRLMVVSAVADVLPWDRAEDDLHTYALLWPTVARFFSAGSATATRDKPDAEWDRWFLQKMVHCFLNAQGMSIGDELAFALRFAYGRARMLVKSRWLR